MTDSLQYLPQEEVQLVKTYLFSIMEKRLDSSLLMALYGIGPFLESGEIWRLMNTIVPRLFNNYSRIKCSDVENFLGSEYSRMNTDVRLAVEEYLDENGWRELTDSNKEILQNLRNAFSEPFLPDFPD
ncbi:MAG TPA: hypothetical protein VIZ18_15120 [Ktedonobacteraceae bacterium]